LEKQRQKKAPSFMKNVLILMFAQIMVKVLGLVYKFVITNFEGFGDTGLGYYSAGYQIYSVLLALSSIGIPSVISKLVSERIAIGDKKGAQRIFRTCMTFFVGIGTVLSLGLFFGAEYIATAIFNVPDTKYVMQVLAPAVAFVAASSTFRGYFAGLNDMKPTSYSQIIEQFFNCVLSITFVYALLGREPYIMAAGGNLSTTLAILLTFAYLIAYYKRRKLKINPKQESPEEDLTTGQLLKKILTISIPVTISSIISVVNPLIDSATVSRCIQTAFASMYPIKEELEAFAMSKTGILSKVDTLVNLPTAVNVAFSTALVPAISGALAKKDNKTASKRMTFSIFASLLIVLPCTAGFIALAQPILNLIYPSANNGAEVLMIFSIPMIFIALNQTINGGLYGLNKTHVPAIALGVGAIIKFVLNIVLISNPNIEIMGAGISSIVCQIVAFLITFITLRKHIKLEFKLGRMIIAPIIAASFMGVCAYFIQHALVGILGNAISTVTAIILGAIIYAITLFMLRILSKEDILMIPFGTKLYALLVKLGIYKEEFVAKEITYAEENKTYEPMEILEEKSKIEYSIREDNNRKRSNRKAEKKNKRKPKHMK
jgi:stage V sporulation protein B